MSNQVSNNYSHHVNIYSEQPYIIYVYRKEQARQQYKNNLRVLFIHSDLPVKQHKPAPLHRVLADQTKKSNEKIQLSKTAINQIIIYVGIFSFSLFCIYIRH